MAKQKSNARKEYNKVKNAERRAAHIAAGLCLACDKPHRSGKRLCSECARRQYESAARRSAFYSSNGRCVNCGNTSRPGRTTCEICFQKQKSRIQNYRQLALNHYGRVCACCGEAEERFLEFDHIHGDGGKQRKEGMGDAAAWLVKNGFPDGFQTLCHNCNRGKYFNGGICPHKTRTRPILTCEDAA